MKSATNLNARLRLLPRRTSDSLKNEHSQRSCRTQTVIVRLILSAIGVFSVLSFNLSSTWAQSGPADATQKNADPSEVAQSGTLRTDTTQSPVATYNLAIEALEAGKTGQALAFLRRAKHLDPRLSQADQAIDFILANQPQLAATENSNAFTQAARALQSTVPNWLLTLSTACFFLLGFGLSARQRYLRIVLARSGEPAPAALRSIPLIYSAAGVSSFALALWWFAAQPDLATVIEAKAHLAASPDPDATALVTLVEGQALTVEKQEGDWVLARTARGEGGWISKKQISTVEDQPETERL